MARDFIKLLISFSTVMALIDCLVLRVDQPLKVLPVPCLNKGMGLPVPGLLEQNRYDPRILQAAAGSKSISTKQAMLLYG
jgi:hypothetical protein